MNMNFNRRSILAGLAAAATTAAHAAPSAAQDRIESWYLIDLRASRAALLRHGLNTPQIRMEDQINPDGTGFKWFDVRSFPKEPRLVIAGSGLPVRLSG